MQRVLIISVLMLFIVLPNAHAENQSRTSLPLVGSSLLPDGLWLFAGANGAAINSDILDNLHNGDILGVRASGSLYQPLMIYSMGLDLDALKFEGGSRANSVAIDLSARYRFTPQWSAGPELLTYLDSGEKISGKGEDFSPFLGGGVARDFAFSELMMRLGGRALIDTTIEGQTVTLAQIYIELGSNFKEPTRVTSHHEEVKVPASIQTNEADIEFEEEAKVAETEESLSVRKNSDGSLSVLHMGFDASSSRLGPSTRSRLTQLARVLKANKSLYDRLEIVGHADQTGNKKTNEALAKNRAITVAEVMRSVGLNKQSRVVGKGASQPLSEINLAANRRVELILTGVKDEKALSQLINSIK